MLDVEMHAPCVMDCNCSIKGLPLNGTKGQRPSQLRMLRNLLRGCFEALLGVFILEANALRRGSQNQKEGTIHEFPDGVRANQPRSNEEVVVNLGVVPVYPKLLRLSFGGLALQSLVYLLSPEVGHRDVPGAVLSSRWIAGPRSRKGFAKRHSAQTGVKIEVTLVAPPAPSKHEAGGLAPV